MAKRTIDEAVRAGGPLREDTVRRIGALACPDRDAQVLDMGEEAVAGPALRLGLRSLPAVAIDGPLVASCAGRGADEAALRAAGLGKPRS